MSGERPFAAAETTLAVDVREGLRLRRRLGTHGRMEVGQGGGARGVVALARAVDGLAEAEESGADREDDHAGQGRDEPHEEARQGQAQVERGSFVVAEETGDPEHEGGEGSGGEQRHDDGGRDDLDAGLLEVADGVGLRVRGTGSAGHGLASLLLVTVHKMRQCSFSLGIKSPLSHLVR